jgi:transposase
MKKLIVGIDISKDVLDYCILQSIDFTVVGRGVIENNKVAISRWLEKFDSEAIIVSMEHTGHYGALLTWLLSERKICFHMLNPLELKRSMGIQRGKTDAIDAYRIACYTINNRQKMEPYSLPTEKLRKLKVLMAARERYVKMCVQLKNSLKANQILAQTINLKELIREEKRQIGSLERSIDRFEDQMKAIIDSTEELRTNYKKITQVIGVGPITAIKCITETDNFLKFSNARKFSCHSGLAPFPYQSGSSIRGRTKTHYLRNKTLKAILFKAAGSAIQHDPQLKRYYQRKTQEGKHKLSVLNAVANKIVLRIFAVVKRDEPFIKLAA